MNLVMRGPAAGIGYSIWLRLRWVLSGILIYIAVVAATVQLLLPSGMMIVGAVGAIVLAASVAHLLTAFTLGPADLGIRGSGYPKNMMVLPVRTQLLVCWPVIYGASTIAILWVLIALFILRPAGLMVPVVWPAALGAASTAWLQAIGWSPFPSPFARVPALAIALTPLVALGLWQGVLEKSDGVSLSIVLASLVWIAAAYYFGVAGLSRAALETTAIGCATW